MNNLPKYLIVYNHTDHRLAYTEANVTNSLRGVSVRYGLHTLHRVTVLSLPGYKDVTSEFFKGGLINA